MSNETDAFLEHFGIKGMHWGVRRSVGSGGRVSGSSKKSPAKKPVIKESADHKEAAKILKKQPSEMSNEELKKLTNRLNLEQNYARLNPQSSAIAMGKKVVLGMVGAATLATTVHSLATNRATKFYIKTAKNFIFKAKFASGITKAITA